MQKLLRQNSKVKLPEMPPLPPLPDVTPPPPAPQQVSSDITDAELDARNQAAKRRGYASLIKAGETGGYSGGTNLGGTKSLLG